jgi:uncharacterized lipoprotein
VATAVPRLLALCAVAALAGCAQYWDKQGATEAELRAADSACAARATMRFPPMLHLVQTGGGHTMPAQGCGGGRGGRNCHGGRAQYVPPTYATVDRNQRLRETEADQCLIEEGWVRQPATLFQQLGIEASERGFRR